MKKLVLGSLITVLVSQAAGCIITSDNGDAVITANWSLVQKSSGQVIPCPPSINSATLYSQPVDSSYHAIGAVVQDVFDCNDNSGRSLPLTPDIYQVWIALENRPIDNPTVVLETFAKTPKWIDGMDPRDREDIADVVSSDKTFTATLLNDGGYMALSWDLKDTVSGAPLSCAEAQADGVGVVTTVVSSGRAYTDDKFNCEAGYGITAEMQQGTYDVSVDAFSDGPLGGGLGPTSNQAGVVIRDKNQVTDIGHLRVNID